MELYLMRHAIAAERGEGSWKSDSERPLTEDGVQKMRAAAKGLRAAGIEFDRILSSPFVRARDTALIVAEAQGGGINVEETDALASGATSARGVHKAIGKCTKDERILLVGHEPDLGSLAAELLDIPATHSLAFKKGGVLRIDLDAIPPSEPGTLVWILTPRLARSLGA